MKLITAILTIGLLIPTFANEETELGKHMDELNGHLKSLRKLEDFDSKVEAARNAQKELLQCFPLIPTLVEGISDEKEKAKLMADYKKLLAVNYAKFCDLELAFLDENEELADEITRELKSIKKQGHQKYIED